MREASQVSLLSHASSACPIMAITSDVEPCDDLQLAARFVGYEFLTPHALGSAQKAAAAASATVASCSPSPPLTPTAPTTLPSRLSGTPPAKIITRPLLDSWMP